MDYHFPPPSPSGTSSSSFTTDASLSPSPQPQPIPYVVCNAPLVAPVPLPYHSPTFLQFDLPDIDEDLSHPPYTLRSTTNKRKHRDLDTTPSSSSSTEQLIGTPPAKRRAFASSTHPQVPTSVRISARRSSKATQSTSRQIAVTFPSSRPAQAPLRSYPYNLRR